MPSTDSRKPCTKCWRDCSPSVTMSRPASSCSFSHSSVASRLAFARSAPCAFHAGHSLLVSASQKGLGRLPAIVVSNMGFLRRGYDNRACDAPSARPLRRKLVCLETYWGDHQAARLPRAVGAAVLRGARAPARSAARHRPPPRWDAFPARRLHAAARGPACCAAPSRAGARAMTIWSISAPAACSGGKAGERRPHGGNLASIHASVLEDFAPARRLGLRLFSFSRIGASHASAASCSTPRMTKAAA